MLLYQYEPKCEECLQHIVVSMQQGIKIVLHVNVVANLLRVHHKEAVVFLLFPAALVPTCQQLFQCSIIRNTLAC